MTVPFTKEQEDALAAVCRAAQAWKSGDNTKLHAAFDVASRALFKGRDSDEDSLDFEMYRYAGALLDRLAAAEAAANGIVKIRELHATPGAAEMRLETDPALREFIASAFVSLLADAPNYAEIEFTTGTPTQSLTLTVQRRDGKTPHQLRKEAEAKLAAAEAERDTLAEIVDELVPRIYLSSADKDLLVRLRAKKEQRHAE